MSNYPLLTQELIDALEEDFPNVVPNLTDSDREIWVKVGTVKVVNFLKRKYQEQFEERKSNRVV